MFLNMRKSLIHFLNIVSIFFFSLPFVSVFHGYIYVDWNTGGKVQGFGVRLFFIVCFKKINVHSFSLKFTNIKHLSCTNCKTCDQTSHVYLNVRIKILMKSLIQNYCYGIYYMKTGLVKFC